MIVLLVSTVFSAQAQYVGNKFFDNWAVGVSGGTVGSVKPSGSFWTQQRPVVGLELSKQLTPVYSIEFEGETYINTSESKTSIDQLNGFMLSKVNLMNVFGRYLGKPRVFEIVAVGGPGYGHSYQNGGSGDDAILTKAGLDFNFNLGKSKAWTFAVKPALVWTFEDTKLSVNRLNSELRGGFVYHFKSSNGEHFMTKARLYDQKEIDELNSKINNLRDELAKKPKEIIKEKETIRETQVLVNKVSYVAFAQNSYVLTSEARKVLDAVPANSKVDIVAGATIEGTKSYNKKLSQLRATVVADYLKAKNVEINSATGIGASKTGQRIAIVTIQ